MPRKILGTGGGTSFSSGGVTSGVIPKENGVGGLVDSALSDNGTVVTSTEQIQGANNTLVTAPTYSFAGNGTTGIYNAATQVRVAAGGSIAGVFSGTAFFTGATGIFFDINNSDTSLIRDGAVGVLALKNANVPQLFRVYGGNGGYIEYGTAQELLTIAAAVSTDTTANLLPANSVIDAVDVRVTTIIPTAATFNVGDATIAARFATGIAVAANTTAVGITHVDQTGTSGPKQVAAAKVRITPNLTPGTATGVVRVLVHYHSFTPPTS